MMKKHLILGLVAGLTAPVFAMEVQTTEEVKVEATEVVAENQTETPEQKALALLANIEKKEVSEEEAAVIIAHVVEELAAQNPEEALQTEARVSRDARRDAVMFALGAACGAGATHFGPKAYKWAFGKKKVNETN